MYENLRNRARKGRTDGENANVVQDPAEQTNLDELMQFFKNCVVDQQKDELKMKMAESVAHRRIVLANPPEPIYKMFGFYFVDPELVNIFLFFFHFLCFTLIQIFCLLFWSCHNRFSMISSCRSKILIRMH